MVSPLPPKAWGGGTFFQKKGFMERQFFFFFWEGGQIYGEIVLHGGTNHQIMLRGEEFHKMHSPDHCKSEKFSQPW